MLNSIQAVALAVQNACFVPSCGRRSSGFGPKAPRTAFGRVVALHGCFYNMLRVQVGFCPRKPTSCAGGWTSTRQGNRTLPRKRNSQAASVSVSEGSTVIVKPEGGSPGPRGPSSSLLRGLCFSSPSYPGEGIFLVQDAASLRLKLSAKARCCKSLTGLQHYCILVRPTTVQVSGPETRSQDA